MPDATYATKTYGIDAIVVYPTDGSNVPTVPGRLAPAPKDGKIHLKLDTKDTRGANELLDVYSKIVEADGEFAFDEMSSFEFEALITGAVLTTTGIGGSALQTLDFKSTTQIPQFCAVMHANDFKSTNGDLWLIGWRIRITDIGEEVLSDNMPDAKRVYKLRFMPNTTDHTIVRRLRHATSTPPDPTTAPLNT